MTGLTRTDFEAAFRTLVSSIGEAKGNSGCIECVRCEGCTDSGFCEGGRGLARCQYCVSCEECTECSHCLRCKSCLRASHSIECDRCVHSAYLVRCVACVSCAYCFGCVGLSGKDFHILNQPYDRQTYFALTGKLARELGLRLG